METLRQRIIDRNKIQSDPKKLEKWKPEAEKIERITNRRRNQYHWNHHTWDRREIWPPFYGKRTISETKVSQFPIFFSHLLNLVSEQREMLLELASENNRGTINQGKDKLSNRVPINWFWIILSNWHENDRGLFASVIHPTRIQT